MASSKRKPSLSWSRHDPEMSGGFGRKVRGSFKSWARISSAELEAMEGFESGFVHPLPRHRTSDDHPIQGRGGSEGASDDDAFDGDFDGGAGRGRPKAASDAAISDDDWTLVDHRDVVEGARRQTTWASVVGSSECNEVLPERVRHLSSGSTHHVRKARHPEGSRGGGRGEGPVLPEPSRIMGPSWDDNDDTDDTCDEPYLYGPSHIWKQLMSREARFAFRYWMNSRGELGNARPSNIDLGLAERSCIKGRPRARELRSARLLDLEVAHRMIEPGLVSSYKGRKALERQRERIGTVLREKIM